MNIQIYYLLQHTCIDTLAVSKEIHLNTPNTLHIMSTFVIHVSDDGHIQISIHQKDT